VGVDVLGVVCGLVNWNQQNIFDIFYKFKNSVYKNLHFWKILV
jgi:hypothetical protein